VPEQRAKVMQEVMAHQIIEAVVVVELVLPDKMLPAQELTEV